MPLNNEAYETRTQGGLNQAMKKFLELMSTAALLIVLMMAVALVGVRVLGLTPYSVLSGSMEPVYSVGDLLYVKKVPTDTLEIGMPVTFVANENLVIVTHRIMDIAIKETKSEPVMLENGKAAMGKDGKPIMQEVKLDAPVRYFLTKGDANEIGDLVPVHENNVLGTPVYAVPYLGYFVMLIKTDAGKIMAACFGLMLVLLMFLPEMLAAIDKSEKQAAGKGDIYIEETEPEDVLVSAKIAGEDVLLCEEKKGDDVVKIDPAAR